MLTGVRRYEGEAGCCMGAGREAAAAAFHDCGAVPPFQVEMYSEHAIGRGAGAEAAAFIGIRPSGSDRIVYGAGIDVNINLAAIHAIANAINHIGDN